jgi:hypothetical protein
MGTLFVDKLDPQSGTSLEIGSSGDTITIPSGCTITNNGTQTGFGGDNKPILSVGLSSTQSMSDNTWTTIVFQTEILDAGGIYNNSTGIATPTAGTYLMIFAANVGGGGSSTLQDAGVKFLIGGSDTTAEQTCNAASNNQSYVNLVTSYVRTFDGSTTVACQAYNNVSSGTPSVYGGGNPRFGATFQMIKLIS